MGLSALNQVMIPLSSLLFLLWKELLFLLMFPPPRIWNRAIDFHVRRHNWRFKHSCSGWGVPERGVTNSMRSWRQDSYLPPLGLHLFGTVGPHVTRTCPVLPYLHTVIQNQNALCDRHMFHETQLGRPACTNAVILFIPALSSSSLWEPQRIFWKVIVQSPIINAKWHRFLHFPNNLS